MFFRCLVMSVLSTPNNSAIAFWVAHTSPSRWTGGRSPGRMCRRPPTRPWAQGSWQGGNEACRQFWSHTTCRSRTCRKYSPLKVPSTPWGWYPHCRCAGWGEAKGGHEVGADILHAKASTEVYAHERTDYLLIAERLAPQSRREVYRLGQKHVKMFHDWKNPIERSELSWFYRYLCHACKGLFDFSATPS